MTLHSWLAFLIATFFICGSRGPNMLQVMRSSIQYGLRRVAYAMAGCFLAVLILIAASVGGVGVILKASPLLFDVMRFIGALYLIYLGVLAWRAPVAELTGTDAPIAPELSGNAIFRQSFLVGMSNPKALFFAAAFFPQFINPDAAEVPQLALLLLTFSIMEIGWYCAYALGGHHLSAWLKRADIRKSFNRVTGGVFAIFGLLLMVRSA